MSAVTPIGPNLTISFQNLLAGKCGIVNGIKEIENCKTDLYAPIDKSLLKGHETSFKDSEVLSLGNLLLKQLFEDANIDIKSEDRTKMGMVIGTQFDVMSHRDKPL